jgi:hypothetical protein
MFKKGQLVRGNRSGAYFEVLDWPLVRVVCWPGGSRRYARVGFIAGSNFTLIGNNYKAKG